MWHLSEGESLFFSCQHGRCVTMTIQGPRVLLACKQLSLNHIGKDAFEPVLWFFIKDLRQAVGKKKKEERNHREDSAASPPVVPPCKYMTGRKVLILKQQHDAHVTHSSVCVHGTRVKWQLCSKWASVLSESHCTLVCAGRRSLAAAPFFKAMNIFAGTKTGYENNCSKLAAAPKHFSSGSTEQESTAVWLVRF